MKKIILPCALFLTMALCLFAGPVTAQQWVGPNGNDGNACTATAPCATFQRAINVGASQINCLGSGSYGAITIQASITIDCGSGNVGNILVSINGTTGISITGSGITVVLRHLAINGLGSSSNALTASFGAGGDLEIEDCTIQRFGGNAVTVGSASGRTTLRVTDTKVTNSAFGIVVSPSGNNITTVIVDHAEISGSSFDGLLFSGNVVVGTVRNSILASNGNNGISSQASQAYLTVEQSSIIANLSYGIQVNTAGSNFNVTSSTISGNGTGVLANPGSIVSFGNNTLNGNAVDGHFTSTTSLK